MHASQFIRASLPVALFSSAFVVYETWCQQVDPVVGLSWFSLFAFIGLMIRGGWEELLGSSKLGLRTLFSVYSCALCFGLYFVILIMTLGRTSAVYVLTMLLLQPIALSFASIRWLGDEVASRGFYFGGMILTLVGLILFRFDAWKQATASVTLWDLGMAAVVFCVCVGTIVRTRLTRTKVVTVRFVFQTSFILTAILSIFSAIATGKLHELIFVVLDWRAMVALVYLGIVPSAVANVWLQKCINQYGLPLVQSAEALKPIWGVALTLGLGLFVKIRSPEIGLLEGAGMCLAMCGVIIAVWKGRPHPTIKI